MDTIARVEKGSYSDYVKPFEADATAIMMPHVTTPGEARHVVEMTRFHSLGPLGRCAMDGGNMAGVYCQIPLADYLAHSNRERVLIFQIESPQALETWRKSRRSRVSTFCCSVPATSAISSASPGRSTIHMPSPRASAWPAAAGFPAKRPR